MIRRVRTRDNEENHLDYSGTSCASDYLCVVHQSYRWCYDRAWRGPMKERSKLWNYLHIQDLALGKVTGIQQILATWYPICWPGFQKIQRSMSLAYSTKTTTLQWFLMGKLQFWIWILSEKLVIAANMTAVHPLLLPPLDLLLVVQWKAVARGVKCGQQRLEGKISENDYSSSNKRFMAGICRRFNIHEI